MQCLDIMFLKINVAIGGTDQRKIHVMAREYLGKLNYNKPVAIHTPIILGIDGKMKMSKSHNNAIFLDDRPEQVAHKIKMAYCPEGSAERNPIFDIVRYIILVWKGSLEIGGVPYYNMSSILREWVERKITAKELKKAVTEALIQILEKIQK